MGATGFLAGIAAAPLAGTELTGAVTWSGLPGAATVVGTALGASVVSRALQRAGRRRGLVLGYGIGFVGALIAVSAMRTGSFPLLLVGSALFGIGGTANQLTRYVVAELHEPRHRGRAVGWIVWAGTIGGVIGPNLLAPLGRMATAAGQPELAGPYAAAAVAMVAVAIAYLAILRPDPSALAVTEITESGAEASGTGSAWRLPAVRTALTVMVTGQIVMVWLMAMTPVHIRESGGDLGRIGLILSAHVFGMYAFAPLAGWIDDRAGARVTVTLSLLTLAAAALLASSAPVGGLLMAGALFLLGLGWSFGFVAGSAILTRRVPADARAGIQARIETAIWLASATAALGSGLLLHIVGYVGLCLLAVAALTLPTSYLVRRRSALAPATVAPTSP